MHLKLTPEVIARCLELRAAGRTLKQIASETGVGGSLVGRAVKGTPRPKRQAAGRLQSSTFNAEVIRLREDGKTQQQIANIVGCGQALVSNVLIASGRRKVLVGRRGVKNRTKRCVTERLDKYTVRRAGKCWAWIGAKGGQGYGLLSVDGAGRSAHILRYEYWIGDIPEGLVVRHKCHNPECTNPEHLELGTPSDNTLDTVLVGGHGPQKLTRSEAARIRKLYATGEYRHKDIAEIYNVSPTTVGLIVRKKRHVKLPSKQQVK